MNIFVHDNIYIRSQTKPKTKADIWFLHGLGEASLCFQEAFTLLEESPYNLYAPDFPGFGASPARKDCQSIPELENILCGTISTISKDRPLHLVGHSMSGIVATEIIHSNALNTIKSLTSIDGTIIVKPDLKERLMGLSSDNSVLETIEVFYEQALSSPALIRYIASIRHANPKTLYHFARETFHYSGKEKAGKRYMDLELKKQYIYGKQSWSDETVAFLEAHNMRVLGAQGGHWPMIDSPEACYAAILDFIEGVSQ